MSEPEAQNEPTMEEILASIRRIISEEDTEEGGKPAAPGEAPAAAAEPKPAAQRAAEGAAVAAAAEPQPADQGADNILELTRMVAEDGSIVDLEAEGQAEAAPAEDAPEAPEPELTEPEPTEPAPTGPETPAAEEAGEETPEAELVMPQEAPAEEAPVEAGMAAEVPDAEETPETEEAPEEEEVGAALAGEEPAAVQAEGDEATGQDLAPAGEGSDFVSAATAAAATASLAAVTKAAMANRQADAVAIGGGRTLEELVRESLAPELKTWLDANLPELVERIVREEIRKMVRRAEDQ